MQRNQLGTQQYIRLHGSGSAQLEVDLLTV